MFWPMFQKRLRGCGIVEDLASLGICCLWEFGVLRDLAASRIWRPHRAGDIEDLLRCGFGNFEDVVFSRMWGQQRRSGRSAVGTATIWQEQQQRVQGSHDLTPTVICLMWAGRWRKGKGKGQGNCHEPSQMLDRPKSWLHSNLNVAQCPQAWDILKTHVIHVNVWMRPF